MEARSVQEIPGTTCHKKGKKGISVRKDTGEESSFWILSITTTWRDFSSSALGASTVYRSLTESQKGFFPKSALL